MNKGLRMVSQFLGNVSEKVNTKLKNWGSILFSKSKVLSGVTLKNTIQRSRVQRVTGMSASIMFGLLALAIIIPLYNVSGTEDTEATSSYVPSTSSITFTSTRNKASINLTPTSTTGTFVQSDTTNTSEVASFNVTTDNATGYTLGIASSTDTTSLTNGTDTLPTITNASTGITATTFNTSTYNNMWGYLPSKYNSAANTGSSAKFYPITTTTATLDETAAANSTANTYTIALGARVTMTKSSGTYTTPTGTAFILTAVGKPASYSITYNQNTTDTVSNLPEATGIQSTSAQSITLSSTAPTRSNYNFLGWCTAQLSDQANGTSGSTACANVSGTYYAAGGTFYIDETTKNVTTLYAMWEQAGFTITFKANGGTGSDYTQTIAGTDYLSGNSFTRSNYYFKGWGTNTSAVAYRPGQSISPTGDMTLYAIWGYSTSTSLYNIVASLNNSRTLDNTTTNGTGLSAKAGIQATITKDNSGVFSYNSSTFGTASDASTSNTIYLYRGILDNVVGTYGSNGDGGNYPNYVKLTTTVSGTTYNTCWRIFRTTASGGVKMIYNGLWTGSTCANATTSAQLSSTTYYNRGTPSSSTNNYGTTGFIAYAGYNYNADYAYNNTGNTTAISNDTLFTNGTASNIRTTVENWYTRTLGTATDSLLESNAGYCNDRSTYDTSNTETTDTIPYGPSTQTNFGTYERNWINTSPSLACPYPSRDLLTTSNGLGYPVALITMDEAVLAGNGYSGKEAYAKTSYLTSGSHFWSLSPYFRNSSGGFVRAAFVFSSGAASSNTAYSAYGVRPVISLSSGTTPASGSGTATDPWVVTPPPTTLTVNFGTGIAGVIVKNSSPNGTTIATVTTSGTSVSNISVGSKYYLLPLYNSGYTFSNMTTSGGTKTAGEYGYYYYTIASGTNTVTVSATTLGTTSSTNMQGLTDANCTPYPMAVKDTRDDEVYYVQRLADGKCWMLENLRLDLVGKISNLTTANTNVDSASLTSLKSGNRSAGDQYATAGVANWTSSYSYSAPLVNMWSKTDIVKTGYGPGRNYAGGYYNYCAASAGSYCYGNGKSEGTSSGNASYDICPAGWRIPTGSSSGEYKALYTAYSSNVSNFRTALSTPLSGSFSSGSVSYWGSLGDFWSSTRYDNRYMYRLYVDSSSVDPTNGGARDAGNSVRCVLKEDSGCFAAGSEVMVSLDGATKPIEDINIGDEVVSYNTETGEYKTTKVIDRIAHLGDERATKLAKLTLENGNSVTMTLNHPVLTTEGFKALVANTIPTLTDKDVIITKTGESAIKSLEVYDTEPTITYNFVVEGDSADDYKDSADNYIVDGIIVRNLQIMRDGLGGTYTLPAD